MEPDFDWRNPDYAAVFDRRMKRLAWIRKNPYVLPGLRAHYRGNPDDFINDWGVTFDPRNAERGLPTIIPMVLFQKQRDFIRAIVDHWKAQKPLLVEKSRDAGVSYCAIQLACTLCLFHESLAIGFGSRKEDYVDKIGQPKSLFWKARLFMEWLPAEFIGEWQAWRDAPHMRIHFPATGSVITGEAGANIGRGDRAAIYMIDESAWLEQPMLVEHALSQTTNCRIDMSSVNGMNNPFAQKRWGGKVDVFIFDWRAQPIDARLLTPKGWREMGIIRVGDRVIGANGRPTKVIGVFPQGYKDVYRVTFSDGASTECCDDHLWEVIPLGNQRSTRRHITRTIPLREIRNGYVTDTGRGSTHNYQIPLVHPITGFTKQDLPLDPYVLGFLLGDGSLPTKSSTAVFVSIGAADQEAIDLLDAALPPGCNVKRGSGDTQYWISANGTYRGGSRGRGSHNPVNGAIRSLGLTGKQSHDKFVPDRYLFATDPEDRLALLRGLLDADGYASKSNPGTAILSTVSKRLAEDAAQLAQSLGGTGKIRIRKQDPLARFGNRTAQRRSESYTVDIKLPAPTIPFRLARKAHAYKQARRFQPRRSIVDIELVGEKECQCIKVAASDGLYLTDGYIVTHNSDPRKDDAWYAKQCAELDPVTVAQEIDRDYQASVTGIVIPAAWVKAAIGAREKLGLSRAGRPGLSFDVADEGTDANATCRSHGIEVLEVKEWSGKGGDIFASTERVFAECDEHGLQEFDYDADGLGADVRGNARVINERRAVTSRREVRAIPFRGSGEVIDPEGQVFGSNSLNDLPGRTNLDFFQNRKAQGWWDLRIRFQRTYRWVTDNVPCSPEDIISLDPGMKNLRKLEAELSQPTFRESALGKMIVEKAPKGMKSPNMADAVMMRYARRAPGAMRITADILNQIARHPRRSL